MRISAHLDNGLNLDRRGHAPAARTAEGPARVQLPAVIEERATRPPAPISRSVAALVAQLVAHVEDMPVTREHRRAEPATGNNAYRAIANLGSDTEPHTARVI
jgi:hypothetical protein